jgi:hypothetical protein
MRHAILLAAAVGLGACAGRNEDETGAAPVQDDTTAVTHVIDSTRTGPPGVGGRPGNATVTVDSVLDDTAGVRPDTMITPDDSLTGTPQDTLGPREPDITPQPDTSSGR